MTNLVTQPRPTTVRNQFAGVDLADKALAATLELLYLRPLLEAMPSSMRSAIDIGAHRGHVTGELLSLGYRVLAVEPQAFLGSHLETRFAAAIGTGRLVLQRCAASDHSGTASLYVGSASTVSTLEHDWTTVAFPEEFRTPRQVEVPLRTAADLLAPLPWGASVGFAKVDVEGHEEQALRGLFDGHRAAPAVVMFEASDFFPDRATACLELLWAQGYRTFDLFVRWGIDPMAGVRFIEPALPAAWHEGTKGFYANLLAYHADCPVPCACVDPAEFVREYQELKEEGRA